MDTETAIIIENRKYINYLSSKVSDKRAEHCFRVAKVSEDIARYYKKDYRDAWIAGLLHDCAREMAPETLKSFVFDGRIVADEFEMEKPVLLHGKVGAVLLSEAFPELSESILGAVRYHVRGRQDMKDLEKIVYIADYIEPGRAFHDPGFMDWTGYPLLEDLYRRVERTISLYYKKKSVCKR